jgi:branched-chain amino acid transport system substrate-binding protein
MAKRRCCTSFWIVLISALACSCRPTPTPFECTDAIGCVTIAPGQPLKLGVLMALSGGPAPAGLDQTRGIELALAARNDQILGHPVAVQIEDERCTAEGGTIAALKVIADPQVVAIVGTHCSGAAVTAAKIMSEAGLTMVSGTNTAPSLTAVGGERGANWQPGYFRATHNDAVGGQAVAIFAFETLGVTQVATIDDGDAYTRGLANAFRQAFVDLGGDVVLVAAVDKGDTDMQPVLTAVAASGAELLFFPIFSPEADLIVLQSKKVAGLEDVILVGGGALLTADWITSVGADGVGMYMAGRAPLESLALDALTSAYEVRYGEPPQTSVFGFAYDAANLLLSAIEAVAVQDANAEGTLHIGRQALRETLYATRGFEGASGTFTCDEFGDCSTASFQIVRLDDPSAGFEGLTSNVIFTYTPGQ